MKPFISPMIFRMALLLLAACASFLFGLVAIRRVRRNLVAGSESANYAPLAAEGLPVHAYHAVIQQLKQQKHELAAQHLSERRKAKASDTLSSAILSSLSCGVLFLNTTGLVRQANPVARRMLGFASPVGLHFTDLLRRATLRPTLNGIDGAIAVEQALEPALTGKAAVRDLALIYVTREGENHVLEVTASPVMAEDASLMGTTLVLTDKTDIERIRHDQEMHREVSSDLGIALRASLDTMAEYAQQLKQSSDPELARRMGENISGELSRLDVTIEHFLKTKAATVGS
ncbi:MAG: PAS domain-containing protein [Terriglobales bacterium]